MFTDESLKVVDNADMSVSSPDYSTDSIDLTLSPDLGSGGQLVAVVVVHSYVAGSATAVTIDIVTSSAADLETTPKTIGTITLTAAELEARDATGREHGAPIVIRANPQHEQATPPAGVTERYLGLVFTHVTATSTTMTVSAYFTECYQGDPFTAYNPAGMTVD